MTTLLGLVVPVYAALVGAIVGSFLNVCVYRWPLERSVLRPLRSHCPACARAIRWYENIPVLSYLALRGRCRGCGTRISIQYPLVEAGVALIWVAAALRFGLTVEALRSAVFLTILLGIALTDARHMVIPDQFSLGGAALGLALAAVPGGFSLRSALLGGGVAYGLLWGVALGGERIFRKPALGVGDIHMMAMIGTFLGLAGALLTVLLGSLLGLMIGVPLAWWRGKLAAMSTYLPLGTYLALGAAVTHTWGDLLIRWYLGMVLGPS